MDRERHFTVEEANAVVPLLAQHFSLIIQIRAQMRGLYQTLQQAGEAPSAESLARHGGPPEVQMARAKFRGLLEVVHDEVRAIEETGALIKDLDTGLCDFLGRRAGRDVFLCWQYGEKEIGHWHDLTAGYAGRQPLLSEESAPRPRPVH